MLLLDPYLGSLGHRLGSSGLDLVDFEFKFFGDGEFYFRVVSDVSGEDVFVVVSMYPDPNEALVRSLFYVSTLKDLGAKHVYFIAPYLAYGRQDRRFLEGECVSAKVVVSSLLNAGADLVVGIDTHNPEAYRGFSSKFKELSAIRVLAEFVKERFGGDEILLISPDKGRVSFVKRLSDLLGVEFEYFEKVRDLETGKIVSHRPRDESEFRRVLEDKSAVLVFDDIISTGGTISGIATKIRKDFNFEGLLATVFTHGLFLPGSIKRLVGNGVSEIFATDSVPNPFSYISLAPVILEFIDTIRK